MNAAVTPDPIRHVILLVMENHSFDQMLGALSSVIPGLDGVPVGGPPHTNRDDKGIVYEQKPTSHLQMKLDPNHDYTHVIKHIANGNSGFVSDFSEVFPRSSVEDRQQIMGYYDIGFLPALHTLARTFTVCDRWFSSLPGPTWPNRFFALSGTSHGALDMPELPWHPRTGAFFDQTQDTIFDRLNSANKSWKVYHYNLACSWILVNQRRPENLARYVDIDAFFTDAASDQLPDFTFIEPKYYFHDQNDDHPPHNTMKAEKLIADVYNAVRSSPAWNSTLLVVFYDEHGGFYDHVSPPATVAPDEFTQEYNFRFDRLGVRVPALLISPWLPANVDHTQFDHTSFLRYLMEKWNLPALGERTKQCTSIAAALQFLPSPRQDTVPFIRVPNSLLYAERPDLEEFDRSGHHEAFDLFEEHLRRVSEGTGESEMTWTDYLTYLLGRVTNWARAIVGRPLMRFAYSLSLTNSQSHKHIETLRARLDEANQQARQP